MLRFEFSPYTSANTETKIVFTTCHELAGKPRVLLTEPCQFPTIPDTDHTLKLIRPLIDLIIVNPDAGFFLRPVHEVIDRAERYHDTIDKPMDLHLMRDKVNKQYYTKFNDFINDINLLIHNATTYNPLDHEVHQAALKLSLYISSLLGEIKKDPDHYEFPNQQQNQTAAETRLAAAIADFQKLKKEAQRIQKAQLDSYKRQATQVQAAKITQQEIAQLIQNIKKLKSNALIGVIEIIAKKPFKTDLLPLEVDLSITDESQIEKLIQYVDCCINDGLGQFYYAWRPQLPQDLQEIRDKYEAELIDWLRPPPEVQT